MPVYGSEVEQVKLGCVAGAGLDYVQLGIQTGLMAAKVLTGEAACEDLPYETIEKYGLYVNSDAAANLGITIRRTSPPRPRSARSDRKEGAACMKLVTYRRGGAEHVGALTPDGSGILPLPRSGHEHPHRDHDLPALRSAVSAAERGSALALSEAELLAPIPRPGRMWSAWA